MTLTEKIESDFMAATKGGDSSRAETLKLLKSEIKNAEIASGKELDDAAVGAIVKKEIKKRAEAKTLYEQGGRAELAAKEQTEIDLLKEYAPEEVSEDVLRAKVKEVISSTPGADFGAVMGRVMGEFKGQADGSVVSRIVKDELG